MRLGLLGMSLLGLALVAPHWASGAPSTPAPKTDEELLAFSLNIRGCVGVVQVLKRTIDRSPDGDYAEFLDVKPIRWFSGACGTAKMRLYSLRHSSFGFLSTSDWEPSARDTVIVFTYADKNRTYVSQTPHTLWYGLALATPERIQFLETNVPRILESQAPSRPDSTK